MFPLHEKNKRRDLARELAYDLQFLLVTNKLRILGKRWKRRMQDETGIGNS